MFQACGVISVPLGEADGASLKNFAICKRDNASAIELLVPGICLKLTVELCFAAMKNNFRTRDIILGHLDVPDCHISVTVWLSQ